MFRKKYRVGELIELPASEQVFHTIEGQQFINLSKDRSVKKGRFPTIQNLYSDRSSYIEFVRNDNWPNIYTMKLNDAAARSIESYGQAINHNRKTDGNWLMVVTHRTGYYSYGTYASALTTTPTPVIGAGDFNCVEYHEPTDTWFFGSTVGKIYSVSESDMLSGIQPTQIGTTPVSGFTNDILFIKSVSSTGTLLHTCGANEIARSTDDGATWTNVGATIAGIPYYISEDSLGNLVLASSSGYFYRSVNDGATWTAITEDISIFNVPYFPDINPSTGRYLVVGSNAHNIYALDDIVGGNLYKLIDTTTWEFTLGGIKYLENNVWIVWLFSNTLSDTTTFLKVSYDDGETWSDLASATESKFDYNTSTVVSCMYDNVNKYFILISSSQQGMLLASLNSDVESYIIPKINSRSSGHHVYMCLG